MVPPSKATQGMVVERQPHGEQQEGKRNIRGGERTHAHAAVDEIDLEKARGTRLCKGTFVVMLMRPETFHSRMVDSGPRRVCSLPVSEQVGVGVCGCPTPYRRVSRKLHYKDGDCRRPCFEGKAARPSLYQYVRYISLASGFLFSVRPLAFLFPRMRMKILPTYLPTNHTCIRLCPPPSPLGMLLLFGGGRRFSRKSSKGPSVKSITAMFNKYAALGDSPGGTKRSNTRRALFVVPVLRGF